MRETQCFRLFLVLPFLVGFLCNGQKRLVIIEEGSQPSMTVIRVSQDNSIVKKLQKKQLKNLSKGYPLSSVDTIRFSGDTAIAHVFKGPYLPFIRILMDDTCAALYAKMAKKPIVPLANGQMLRKVCAQLLQNCMNEGYPFTRVRTEQLDFNGAIPTIQLRLEKGRFYRNGMVILRGDSSINEKMLSNVVGFKTGEVFNQAVIDQVGNRIKLNGCLEEIKPAELLFNKQTVDLYLYVRSKKISSINGALGLQPSAQSGRVMLTGDLNLKLQNTLKRGELIQLNWRSPQTETQQVNGLFGLPFLFGSPFGIESSLYLYRRDSTFLDVKSQFSLSYLLSNGFTLKAFYLFSGSSLLSGAGNNPSFSALSNTRSNVYGLNLSKKKLDYIPNPSRGYWLSLDAGIGNRKARSSDTAEWTPQTTYRSSLSFEYYVPIYKRHVMKIHLRGSLYYAPIIYQNEAFRIGGLNTLRGFNEEELFTTSFMTSTLEYRFLVDRNSALFAFFDQAFYKNASANNLTDTPFGFGGGFSFGTNLGIFSISYGLGKQFNNPILLRNGKVHFGYIAYF